MNKRYFSTTDALMKRRLEAERIKRKQKMQMLTEPQRIKFLDDLITSLDKLGEPEKKQPTLRAYMFFHKEVWVPYLLMSKKPAKDNLCNAYAFFREYWPDLGIMGEHSFNWIDVTPEYHPKDEHSAFTRHIALAKALEGRAEACKSGMIEADAHAVSEVTRRLVVKFIKRYGDGSQHQIDLACRIYDKARDCFNRGAVARTLKPHGGSGRRMWEGSVPIEAGEHVGFCPVCGNKSLYARPERVMVETRQSSIHSSHMCGACNKRFF